MKYIIASKVAISAASLFHVGFAFNSLTTFTRVQEISAISRCKSDAKSVGSYWTGCRSRAHAFKLKSMALDENDLPSSDVPQIFPEDKHSHKQDSLSTEKSRNELAFNFLLLSAAFGFALYTILNIDHGMTRGWTQTEILARIPFDNWRQYEDSLAEKPVFTKTLINVIIYLLGDWLSQTIFLNKEILDFDAARTLRNGFIGLCFGPIVHQYYEFSDSILPPAIAVNRLYKIFMDQTIYLGVKCSVYIAAVGLLGGQSLDEVKDSVQTRIKPIMFTAWKFWPLVHCVTYGVIPARHRILWVNSVDLIWNAILAQAVSKNGEEEGIEVDLSLEESIEMSQIRSLVKNHSDFVESNGHIEVNEWVFQNSTFPTRNNSLVNVG